MSATTASNAANFTGKAAAYAKGRPSYALRALAYLSELGLGADSVVADIGSGTGIFSKQLLELGAKVFAVEPNKDMRKQAETDLGSHPKFHSVAAGAEDTTLEAGCLDFITAAQAFHWFDPVLFKKECRRLLKTGGRVVLLWNNMASGSAFFQKYDRAYKEMLGHFRPGICFDAANTTFDNIGAFFETHEIKKFENTLSFNKEKYVQHFLSVSTALLPSEPGYERYVEELEALFDAYHQNGRLDFPNETVMYIGAVF